MITERNRKMLNGWNLFGNSALRLTKVNLQEAHRPVLKEHKHTKFAILQKLWRLSHTNGFGKCACRHRTASVLHDDVAVKCTLQITDYKTQTNKELV